MSANASSPARASSEGLLAQQPLGPLPTCHVISWRGRPGCALRLRGTCPRVPKTTGDLLFERYLRDHGYEPGPHEPHLSNHGIATRPDFIPRRGDGAQAACEVEQFRPGASKVERRLAGQRTATASAPEVYRPVRQRVGSAARQLKPLVDLELPLVVVLANPDGAMVDLSVAAVTAALYGNPTFTIPIDPVAGGAVGERRLEFGRDGKLTNDHPYLSAVALLRLRERSTDRIAEIAAQMRDQPRTFDEAASATLELLRRVENEELPGGDYVFVDVIETMSASAAALDDDWFRGDQDSRWRLNDDGYFERRWGVERS